MHIHYLTGEFARSASETAFLSNQIDRTRAMLGFTLVFCVAFFLSFFVTDIAVLGLDAAVRDTLPARLLVAAVAGTWAWLAYRRPLSIRAMRLAASLSEGIALCCFMVVAMVNSERAGDGRGRAVLDALVDWVARSGTTQAVAVQR